MEEKRWKVGFKVLREAIYRLSEVPGYLLILVNLLINAGCWQWVLPDASPARDYLLFSWVILTLLSGVCGCAQFLPQKEKTELVPGCDCAQRCSECGNWLCRLSTSEKRRSTARRSHSHCAAEHPNAVVSRSVPALLLLSLSQAAETVQKRPPSHSLRPIEAEFGSECRSLLSGKLLNHRFPTCLYTDLKRDAWNRGGASV